MHNAQDSSALLLHSCTVPIGSSEAIFARESHNGAAFAVVRMIVSSAVVGDALLCGVGWCWCAAALQQPRHSHIELQEFL